MRASRLFFPTLKEDPAEAEAASHKLSVRAGLVRQLAAGLYIYLPLGLRVLEKINTIIREEMNAIGAQEISMPVLHPAEIWQQTGRYDSIGAEMFRLRDRGGRDMVLGMTHEEIITWLASRELRSYRDLPQVWYQIQTKLRDEARPKSGILRTREFIMKDSYSFDVDEDALDRSYQLHIEAYNRIFTRTGIQYYMVESDPGMMGGATAHEYMAPSPAGEDEVALCGCGYAANLELACSQPDLPGYPEPGLEEVATPEARTIEQVSNFLDIDPALLIKSLLVMAGDEPVLVMIRGDQQLQESKLAHKLGEFRPAGEDEIREHTGAGAGFIGPLSLEIRKIADQSLAGGVFTVGANRDGYHIKGVVPGQDFQAEYHDMRRVKAGEACARCGARLRVERVIEVGNIFKLGTKYSEPLGATYLDQNGREQPIIMGSYGIGPARIAAAAIEQYADEKGIIWPVSIAPFQVHLVLVQPADSQQSAMAEKLNADMMAAGLEVLYDERDISPGAKFADAELLGCPVRVTIGKRAAADGMAEVQIRSGGEECKFELGATAQGVVRLLKELG
ncbi:proline--tRNA ligase [bacterium BMS3Abin01]|nr:proline--tRNA ligase [bacterium BMS3Abin01]HDY69465.1 proline--tRNA ligase [Actinomycetota bacterium]